jgi:hypothetical protein
MCRNGPGWRGPGPTPRALRLVQSAQSTWTRADFLKQLALVLPVETRRMTPDAALALLHELADGVDLRAVPDGSLHHLAGHQLRAVRRDRTGWIRVCPAGNGRSF